MAVALNIADAMMAVNFIVANRWKLLKRVDVVGTTNGEKNYVQEIEGPGSNEHTETLYNYPAVAMRVLSGMDHWYYLAGNGNADRFEKHKSYKPN